MFATCGQQIDILQNFLAPLLSELNLDKQLVSKFVVNLNVKIFEDFETILAPGKELNCIYFID